jgi:hypothetical protein
MATTPLTSLQLVALSAGSIRSDRIKKKPGSDMSYVEAFDIRAMLIKIFGYAEWSAEVTDAQIIQIERDVPKGNTGQTTNFRVTALCRLKLTIHQTGATYEEAAVASQSGSQIGEVADFAVKTAESDALKRCAMNLGTQFGLSLYDDGSLKDVVGMGFAPGQEWNVPEKMVILAGEHQMAIEAGEIPTAKAPNPQAAALVQRALRAGDDVPVALDTSYDSEEALQQ